MASYPLEPSPTTSITLDSCFQEPDDSDWAFTATFATFATFTIPKNRLKFWSTFFAKIALKTWNLPRPTRKFRLSCLEESRPISCQSCSCIYRSWFGRVSRPKVARNIFEKCTFSRKSIWSVLSQILTQEYHHYPLTLFWDANFFGEDLRVRVDFGGKKVLDV